jgi:serine/threonine protein kinase
MSDNSDPRSRGRIRVGKFELGQTLGEGSFAKVKYARNTETNQQVAIKIIDKEKIYKCKMVDQVFTILMRFPPLKTRL